MPDANQWEVVNAGDDLLLPLYRALERHGIQKATNFRIDDTGAMVIALKKEIDKELAARTSLGESTKDVRTGINATGSYWETPNGPPSARPVIRRPSLIPPDDRPGLS